MTLEKLLTVTSAPSPRTGIQVAACLKATSKSLKVPRGSGHEGFGLSEINTIYNTMEYTANTKGQVMPSRGSLVEAVSASSPCKLPGREPEEVLGKLNADWKGRTYSVSRILGVVNIDDDTGVVGADVTRNSDLGWIAGSTTSHGNLSA